MSTATQTTVSKATLTTFLRLFKEIKLHVETCQGMVLLSCPTTTLGQSTKSYATICIGDHSGEDVTFEVHHSEVVSYVRNVKPKEAITFTVDGATRELIADSDTLGEVRWTIVPKSKDDYPSPLNVFDNLGEFKETISLADVNAAKSISDRTDPDCGRYTLSCVLFDEQHVIATDGRRLVKLQVEGNFTEATLVETSLIEYAAKFGFEIDTFARCCIAGDVVLSNRDGRYPTWRQVVPDNLTVSCVWDGKEIRKQVDAYIAKQKAAKITDAWGLEIKIGDGVKVQLDSRFVKAAVGDLGSVTVSYESKKQGNAKTLKVPVVLTSDERPGWTEVIMPMAPDR